MFTAKILASLLLVAAAGVVNAERGRVDGADGPQPALPAARTAAVANDGAAIRRAVQSALATRIRQDLADPSVGVSLEAVSFDHPNAAIVAANGNARVSLGAGGDLPVHFDADWNPATLRLERIDYQVAGAAQPPADAPASAASAMRAAPEGAAPVGASMRAAIAARVGQALQSEFAGQHSKFEVLGIERVDSGRRRMLVTGTGVTRFDGEGAAFTRFRASLDKFDGRVLHVDYDLLQDVDPQAIAAR